MPRKSLTKTTVASSLHANGRKAANTIRELTTLEASVLSSRTQLMIGLGQSYEGVRDIYNVLGYKKTPDFTDYNNRFVRQGLARRIITCFPDATWRGKPLIYETEDENIVTPFEKEWKTLVRELGIWHYFSRTDKIAGIGKYAVLFLGFSDGKPPDQPVVKTSGLKLLYLQPYSEINAVITKLEDNKGSPRYGLPTEYQLKTGNVVNTLTSGSTDVKVHHSRIIHVADGLVESNVYGTPRLECILNNLQDLETIAGGSSEMFWRGAFPGLGLEMDPQAVVDDEDALEEEIDDYIHNLRRVLRLKGIKANSLAPTVADPASHIKIQLELISGATQIPLRILIGSERGELASITDQRNWNDKVSERREDFADAVIIRPFIKKLIDLAVLPPLRDEADLLVYWPDVNALDDKSKAEVTDIRTRALQAYITSGASSLVGPMAFLTTWMGFTQDEARVQMEEVEKMLKDEQDGIDLPDDEEEVQDDPGATEKSKTIEGKGDTV